MPTRLKDEYGLAPRRLVPSAEVTPPQMDVDQVGADAYGLLTDAIKGFNPQTMGKNYVRALEGDPDMSNFERMLSLFPAADLATGGLLAGVKAPAGALVSGALRRQADAPTSMAPASYEHRMHNRPPQYSALDLLNARASQMQLAPGDRTKGTVGGLFDLTPEAYERTPNLLPQRRLDQPSVAPGEALPANNRMRGMVDNADEIAEAIANKARGGLRSETQYFYAMGPVYERLKKDGLSDTEARDWLRQFGQAYGGTSPRTPTDQNLRSAFLLLNKQKRGKSFDSIEGVGTVDAKTGKPGISEKGYPMLNLHRSLSRDLLDDVDRMNTNPKPSNFQEGAQGNLDSITADTHAIRGAVIAMNDVAPGSLPREFFISGRAGDEAFTQYRSDPAGFLSSPDGVLTIDDSLKSRTRNKVSSQVEYGVIADIYERVAQKLGVRPAEAQSLAWFASGANTNLASEAKSIPRLLEEAISRTSKIMDVPRDDVWARLRDFDTPLLSISPVSPAMIPQPDAGAPRFGSRPDEA
jgi:hypothetical protein